MKNILLAVAALLTFLFLYPPADLAHAVAKPGKDISSWQVTCATTATKIVPDAVSVVGWMCTQSGTTATFVGGKDVNTTTTGQDICTTNCPINVISAEAEQGYCVVAASTETLTCTGSIR